ncbi:MAG: inositol-3-phosphate synthase [Planctomycetota bacterium]|nr:inositol-3-phosphate synthase [Planctomycetota bacterium]
MQRTGVWFIGAHGCVATCAAVGAMAFARGLLGGTGMVSEHSDFAALGLAPVGGFIFGGHEVAKTGLGPALKKTQESTGLLPDELILRLAKPLDLFGREVKRGYAVSGGRARSNAASVVGRLRRDIESFRRRNRLERVVVVNVASAEPAWEGIPGLAEAGRTADGIRRIVRGRGGRGLPPSMLYAIAAMESGCAYINFTSSLGASLPGMDELAREHGVPHAGRDGKTGETLVKTALAPMFTARRLRVLSWEGHNLLGNSDGATLRDERVKRAKTANKDAALRSIIRDDAMHSAVRIDYVPSLADWKTAWDFIHFEGFLGARMAMQFIWQGCDSALAAPLVLDLVRFADLALRRGESGPMPHLACFFKDPVGTDVHDFQAQYGMLRAYVR